MMKDLWNEIIRMYFPEYIHTKETYKEKAI